MVYQQPYATLDPRQKIGSGFKELIRYHGFAPKGKERALTEDVLVKVGLEPQILAHLLHQISGGEAQRVAIARAVCAGPRLLLLDEAFKGLDEQCRRDTVAYIRRHTPGASLLCVTHDPEEAALLGGRCLDLSTL